MGELVTRNELKSAIEGGASYAEIVKRVRLDTEAAPPKKKANLAARKKAFQAAVANSDKKVFASLRASMRKYVSSMAEIEMTEPRELTPAEAQALMSEVLTLKNITEFLASRNDTAKEIVFTAIDEKLRAKGIDDPEMQNGSIPVPELGKTFKREGAGFKDATLDLTALEAALGEDASKVFVEKTIPAKVVKEVDEEALGKLIMDKPDVLDKVRKTLIPGGVKPARFVIRDYNPEEDQ